MMQWAVIEFTHYTDDDAMFDNFSEENWRQFSAQNLSEAIDILTRYTRLTGALSLARIDDSDSFYGGVFTDAAVAEDYWNLDDADKDTILCWCLVADYATDLNLDRVPSLGE